jgi:hypothetical protein
MATATKGPPMQSDSKYMLANGNIDYDKYLKDYYAYLEKANQTPDVSRASMFQSKENGPTPPEPGGHYSDTGAWVGDDTVNDATFAAQPSPTPKSPDVPDKATESDGDAPKDEKEKSARPWWETDADAADSATGQMMGGEGAARDRHAVPRHAAQRTPGPLRHVCPRLRLRGSGYP